MPWDLLRRRGRRPRCRRPLRGLLLGSPGLRRGGPGGVGSLRAPRTAVPRVSAVPKPGSGGPRPRPAASGGLRLRRAPALTPAKPAKTPISLHTLLVRAKSRVARCVRLRRPGLRRSNRRSGPRNRQRPRTAASRSSFGTGPEVCETGAVSSAAPAPRVIAVVGPTAAGKSDLGVSLARAPRRRGRQRRLHAALPRHGHRHRQADARGARRRPAPPPGHLGRHRAASVAEYQRLARAEIDRLLAEGRWPVLVGGSGLYVRGAIDAPGVPRHRPRGAGPPGGGARRCAAPAPCTPGWPPPTPRPAERDPARATAAASSAPSRSSRSPASPSPPTCPGHDSVYDTVQIGVDVARPELDERIARRVDRMWEAGLVDEVRALEARGPARGAYGVARARLPAGARRARGGVHRGGGARRDRPRHQALRAPSGLVVPARPAGALAQRGRGGSRGTSRAGADVARTTGHSLITSWHRDAPAVIAGLWARAIIELRSTSGVRVGRARGDGGRPSRHRTRHRTRCVTETLTRPGRRARVTAV